MGQDNVKKESIDEEIIKELMDLRNYLERHIQELEEESEKFRALFKIIDEVIVTRSFKKAETIPIIIPEKPITIPEKQPPQKFKEEIPLNTSTGLLLATVYVGDEDAKIVPAKELTFTVNILPFQTFLITRILEPMRVKDSEDSQAGELPPEQVFAYETIAEGDVIKELIIRNFRTRKRLRDIISSSRWTFEKMYEKVQTSGNILE